ncbi:restriction endonuclease subunit S [Aeromonas caviae]|uniref:restriction endonuclease subunit S n=1 Tax=Aeromonas caviae TaxID=648 RepID=UPI002B45D40E|nr:restriction endonuclease subunit S [Aeromonas caviae]
MKDSKKTVVPKLRFPGFDEPWSIDPLSKTLTEHKLKNTNARDVFSVSMESGIVNQVEHLGRSFAASDTAHYNLGRRFDLVYTKSPLKAFPFGIVKQCKFDGEVALSPLYGVFTPVNPHAGLMIEAYFESPNRSAAFLSPLCQKGAKNTIQITNTVFLSGCLPLPIEPAEQKKIADCLSSLDELIAIQGRKVEALKTYTRGLMQLLFPRPGETLPRLRFPEFRNAPEWEPTTLDGLVRLKSGGTPSKANPEFWNGSIPWVSAKDMKRLFLDDSEDHISVTAVNNGATLVPGGTVLMLTRGMTLLKDVPICVLRREMSFNQDVKALIPKGDTYSLFVAHLLLGNKQRLLKMVDIAGHGTGKLNTDALNALKLAVPTPTEQQRIADFFSSLNN